MQEGQRMVHTAVVLPRLLLAAIKANAKRRNWTMSEEIRDALWKSVDNGKM